jgi:hypothetical protein
MQMIPLTEPDINIVKRLLQQQNRKYGALFVSMLLLFLTAWLWLHKDLGLAANGVGLVLLLVLVLAAGCTGYLQFGPLLKDRKAKVKYVSEGTVTRCYFPSGAQRKGASFFIAMKVADAPGIVKWLQLSSSYYEQLKPGDVATFTWLPCSKHVLKASFADTYVTALQGADQVAGA